MGDTTTKAKRSGTSSSSKETNNKSGTTGEGTNRGSENKTTFNNGESSELPIQLKPKVIEIPIDTEIPEPEETEDGVPKPKRKYKKREPKKDTSSGSADMDKMVQGAFGLLALAVGNEWNISEQESKMLSEPLSNILERYDLSEKLGQASDGFLLLSASAMIVVPRLVVTLNKRKSKKMVNIYEKKEEPVKAEEKNESVVKDNVTNIETINNKNSQSSEKANRGSNKRTSNSSNDGSFIKSLSQSISNM